MATGRIRRSARRGLAAAALGWVGVAAASVLAAPPAAAASNYVVHIKDLTPPVASVDKNGTVRFIDEIPDKTVSVSVGPGGVLGGVTVVNVTAKTQVILTLPSGDHPLEPTTDPAHPTSLTAWDEVFHTTCITCKITYRYELSSGNSLTAAISDAAISKLPKLPPVPTPFVVNTLVPLPNVPSVGLPKLPQIVVPGITGLLPKLPNVPLPKVPVLPKGGTVFPKAPSGGGPTIAGIPGNIYSYLSADGTPQLSPGGSVAQPGFDSSRYFGTSGGSGSGGSGVGSGTVGSGTAGTDSGVTVPVYPQHGAKPVDGLTTDSAQQPAPAASRAYPAITLAALLVLGTAIALIRTFRARSSR